MAYQPIVVDRTLESGGQVQFAPATVSANGTTDVRLDWAGATVNPGQTVRVGASSAADTLYGRIDKAWWSVGGAPAHALQLVNANFNPAPGYSIIQIRMFDDPGGSHLIGTEWLEGAGQFYGAYSSPFPTFVRLSAFHSDTEIPLEDLNPSLGGFGDFSGISLATPEPSTSHLALAGVLWVGWRLLRRQRGALPCAKDDALHPPPSA